MASASRLKSSITFSKRTERPSEGSTPELMWESMDYKGYFAWGYKAVPIDWTGFKLNTYMGGRIFRFEIGYGRMSPLEIKNKTDEIFILTPYLSIIDGKVTVVN